MSGAVAVLIPVKAFGAAKGRLAEVLDGLARADLARRMAETVVTAAAPLPVTVVCDDDDVDAWARSQGADVVRVDGPGLNRAVEAGMEALANNGVATVVVALLVFCVALVGSELLGRLSGTPGSTPVGAVGRDVVYVVQPGDTLWEIGLRLNPPGRDIRPFVDRLIDAAGTSVLQPGQRIVLPADW